MSLILASGKLQANKKYTILVQIDWNENSLSDKDNTSFMLKVNSPVGFTLCKQGC
jgi:hypothetical protein